MEFIDLHAHYPMHLGLPRFVNDHAIVRFSRRVLYGLANQVANYEPIHRPRVTARMILESNITGLASVLYDPEDEFLVRQEPHPAAIEHIRQQIKQVESDASANGIDIAKTWSEIERSRKASKPFIVHSVEGGQSLSGNPDHVRELEGAGVVYIVLAHLRYMGLAGCAKALPCKTDFWQKLINQDQDPYIGLSRLGFEMLEAILDSKVMLDVTHCSDLSRNDIMRYYKSIKCRRPVISSHSGVQYLAGYELNLSDEWIRFISDSGGIIGVILFPFWLASQPKGRNGIDLVGDTIDHIRSVGGDDCVGIGTDLDGFIQPIRECKNYSELPSFLDKLAKRYESEPSFLEKLLSKNALRVLAASLKPGSDT